MSIKYSIISKKKGDWIGDNGQYLCFGRLNAILSHFKNKTTNINYSDFDGIYLDLERNPKYSVYSEEDKLDHEKLYQDLGFERLFEGLVHYKYEDDVLQGIYFYKDIPFYYVVAAVSCFRMKSNHETFFPIYNYMMEQGYLPIVSYYAAINISVRGDFRRSAILDVEGRGDEELNLTGRSEHMPFSFTGANVRSVKVLSNKLDSIDKSLKTMYEELSSCDMMLSYNGRDTFFTGATSPTLDNSIFYMASKDDGMDENRYRSQYVLTPKIFYNQCDILQEALL